MDTTTTTDSRPVVALPGVCAKVRLPMLPNFLQPVTGGQAIPLGELSRDDVALLGLAWQRALACHWHERFTAHHGLVGDEANQVGVQLIHPAIVETMARREADRHGFPWNRLDQETRDQRMDRMRGTLAEFIQELTRYG